MGLETATFFGDLNSANPTASDPKAQGDDHLRLIKTTALNTFPGFAGVVIGTADETGSSNAYAITLSPAPAAYTALVGALLMFKATHANTGPATLNVNSLGAKPIVDVNGGALASGDIANGSAVAAVYDGTSFCLVSPNDRAPIDSPTFTGTPAAPTPSAADNSTKLATTAYVDAADALKANLASPALTGTPTAPTAAVTDNSTQIATTAFVVQMAFQAALPAQTGNANKYLQTDGTSASWGSIAGAGAMLFGDGSDGNVTINSGTTTLSRDMYYNSLTLSGTGVLNPNGWRIFVKGTLDLSAAPAGAIALNGSAGANAVAAPGTTQNIAAGGAGTNTNSVGGGGAGGAGGGGNTSNGTAATGGGGGAGTAGGASGGNGQAGASGQGSGQSAGAGNSPATIPAYVLRRPWTSLLNAEYGSSTLLTGGAGGAGGTTGRGGIGAIYGASGGAGGGGGGVVQIEARFVNRGASTAVAAIQVKGANGGNAVNAYDSTSGAGAGGCGGGGGWVYIVCEQLIGATATNAVDVSGGSGGAGGSSVSNATYSGGGGGYGGSGRLTVMQLTPGTYSDTGAGTSGAGQASATTAGSAGGVAPTTRYSL